MPEVCDWKASRSSLLISTRSHSIRTRSHRPLTVTEFSACSCSSCECNIHGIYMQRLQALQVLVKRYAEKVKVKFSHTRYRALGPELIPEYRQSARRWRKVNHTIDLAVGCHYFLPGLQLPPSLSPDGATCKRQHTSDSSFTTNLSTQKGRKAELA